MAEALEPSMTLNVRVHDISRNQTGNYLDAQNHEEPTGEHGIRYLGGGFKIEQILRQPTSAYVPPGLQPETQPLRLVQFGGGVSPHTSRLVHESSLAIQIRERMNAYPKRQFPPWQPDRSEELDPRIMADLPESSTRIMIVDRSARPTYQETVKKGIFKLADRALVDEGLLVVVGGSLEDARTLQEFGFVIKALQAPLGNDRYAPIGLSEPGWEIVAKKIAPKYRKGFNADGMEVSAVELLADIANLLS